MIVRQGYGTRNFVVVPHINQPGGPFQSIDHPAVSGRELELRALADAVRRLVAATVSNTATAAETAALAIEANELAERMEAHIPDEPPPRYGFGVSKFEGPPITHRRAPFDLVTGICNPAALTVEMSVDTEANPAVARGRANFSVVYEGPPGCVHGAAIASVFDMVFTSACSLADASGPTTKLSVQFRRPTLLGVETTFEGWVEDIQGQTTKVRGKALQGDQVTARAEGTFRQLELEAIRNLSRNSQV
ncbi:PaaI family thioesterase [Candidatus Poriferisocius sp.]|uniref:PaaI family thioesterase n=1 Tax=Candidatus Poriferisocius sp. TaxID=3101276 RepID=UPI003B01AE4D